MKKYLILLTLSFFSGTSYSAVIPVSHTPILSLTTPADPLQHFSTLSIKEVQQLAGRKLKLKEKIAVKFLQWKIRKGFYPLKKDEEKKDKGKTAMIFGIIGLASLFLPIPYIGGLAALVGTVLALVLGYQAKKEDPTNRKAKTAIVLGWISVGLFVLALVIVVAVLSSWGGIGWG